MAKVFRDDTEVSEGMMEGFTVARVYIGINAEGSGMMMELERQINNATIGIDVSYDSACEDGKTPFMVSEEYAKRICQ